MSLRSEREEKSTKVLMVLNSIGRRVDVHELSKDVLLDGMTNQQIGAFLRFLCARGEVKRYKDKTWGPIKNEVAQVKTNGVNMANMFFVINVTQQSLKLDVGGLRLPVVFE
jgi:hypothetical protein